MTAAGAPRTLIYSPGKNGNNSKRKKAFKKSALKKVVKNIFKKKFQEFCLGVDKQICIAFFLKNIFFLFQ